MAVILTWQVIFSGGLALNLAPSPASPLKRLLSTERACESSPGLPPARPGEQQPLRGSRPPEGREIVNRDGIKGDRACGARHTVGSERGRLCNSLHVPPYPSLPQPGPPESTQIFVVSVLAWLPQPPASPQPTPPAPADAWPELRSPVKMLPTPKDSFLCPSP